MPDTHVIVTSIVGTFHRTDVMERPPLPARQWSSTMPVALTDEPGMAFGIAAANALASAREDRITRDVWLVMDGVVADHVHVRGH